MNEFYEKMREDADRRDQSRIRGLTSGDVVAKNHDDLALRALVAALCERPLSVESSFRLASFIYEGAQERIPAELRQVAADNVADCMQSVGESHNDPAVEIFLAWGCHRSDYRDVALSLLRHADSPTRRVALSYADLFLRPHEFELLLDFRHDLEISETITMGGPLRYTLRDHALGVLERLTGLSGENIGDCFEDRPEGRVYYRSWSPFLNAYEAHKARIAT